MKTSINPSLEIFYSQVSNILFFLFFLFPHYRHPRPPRRPSPAPENCFSNSAVLFTALLQAFIWFETGPAAQSKETWSRTGSREENYVPVKNRFTEHLVMSKGIIKRISWGLLVLKPWRIAFWEEETHRQIPQLETRAFRQVLCSLWPSSAPQVAFIWRGSEKQERMEYSIYLFFFSVRATVTAGACGSRGGVSGVRCQPGLGSPGWWSLSGAVCGLPGLALWLTCSCSEYCSGPLLLR